MEINGITFYLEKPHVIFGLEMVRRLTHIWNLKITYPDKDNLPLNDDVKPIL